MIELEESAKEQLEENEVEKTNEAAEVIETSYTEITEMALCSEIRTDVPGYEGVEVTVTGNPYEVAEILDWNQGDNAEGAGNTCSLTSIANICTLAGMDITEQDVVTYAIENNVCYIDYLDPSNSGGMDAHKVDDLLEEFGIECYEVSASEFGVDEIAEAIENGQGVMVGLDAGSLWDDPYYSTIKNGQLYANHCITVTGVARNSDGEVAGFYICDSGRHEESDAARFLTVDEFTEAYNGSVRNAVAIVTEDSIREV